MAAGTADSLVDRLRLNASRVDAMSTGLRELAGLPDPIGTVVRGSVLPNGLHLTQVRVPLGVVAIIYEARPNVTVDAAGIALKAGNAALLRGSASAYHSNRVLVGILPRPPSAPDCPPMPCSWCREPTGNRCKHLMTARGLVDVIIPRGGAGLIQAVVNGSTVPVIETGVGNCHVYVDATADTAMALEILVNSKARRPSVCNAAETLLVHADAAATFVPAAVAALREAGVTVHADAAVIDWSATFRVWWRPPPRTSTPSSCRWTSRLPWCGTWMRRSSTSVRTAPATPRRLSPLAGGGRRVRGQDRRGRGDGQRIHCIHRWWRVRVRRGDRNLDSEAACPWADGTRGADQHEVRGHRQRSDPGLLVTRVGVAVDPGAGDGDRVAESASWAGRSTPSIMGIWSRPLRSPISSTSTK